MTERSTVDTDAGTSREGPRPVSACSGGLGARATEARVYYQSERVTIYHGDCLPIMREMGPGAYDLVFTSPPYNLGISGGGNGNGWFRSSKGSRGHKFGQDGYDASDDAMDPAEYVVWQRECLQAMWDGLGDDGAIFYNHRPRSFVGMGLVMPPCFGGPVPIRQVITWDRGTGTGVTTASFTSCYEWIVMMPRGPFRLASKSLAGYGDVWRIPMENGKDLHPATFPLALPARAVNATTADVVLDPFMGSGSTILAALQCGRRAIGIELSERYCEIAAQRIEAAEAQHSLFPAAEQGGRSPAPRTTNHNQRRALPRWRRTMTQRGPWGPMQRRVLPHGMRLWRWPAPCTPMSRAAFAARPSRGRICPKPSGLGTAGRERAKPARAPRTATAGTRRAGTRASGPTLWTGCECGRTDSRSPAARTQTHQ